MRSFSASVGSRALQTFAARVVITVLAVLTGVIIARLLGPQGKGVYSGIQTMLAIPIAVTGGAGAGVTYLMTKRRRSIQQLFPALAAAFAAITLAIVAGCVVYAAVRGWSLELAVFLCALPPSIVISWQQSYYVAIGRIGRFNAQCVAVAFCTLVGVIIFCWVLGFGTPGALAAWLVVLYACAVVVVGDMVRNGARLHLRNLRLHATELARIGSQSGLNGGLGLLNYTVDSLMLIALLGLPLFGVYSIAVSIGEMLFTIARSVNTAIGREIGTAEGPRAAEMTALVVRSGVAICFACALPLAFLAPLLVHAVYGPRFDAAALPLRLLLPGIVVFATTGTFANYFILQLGRPLLVSVINVAMIAVQAGACFALIPRFGLAGAAAASSAAYVAGTVVNTVMFCRLSGLTAAALWIPRPSDLRRFRDVVRELAGKRVVTSGLTCADASASAVAPRA